MTPAEKHPFRPAEDVCCQCADLVAGAAGALSAHGRCCESCDLIQCKDDAALVAHACEGFADTLAAALDQRQPETGLHPGRIACPTPLLSPSRPARAASIGAPCCTTSARSARPRRGAAQTGPDGRHGIAAAQSTPKAGRAAGTTHTA